MKQNTTQHLNCNNPNNEDNIIILLQAKWLKPGRLCSFSNQSRRHDFFMSAKPVHIIAFVNADGRILQTLSREHILISLF